MKEREHTPGPWSYRQGDDHSGYEIDADNGSGPRDWLGLARVEMFIDFDDDGNETRRKYKEESLANARLVAAAPELLEALEETAKYMQLYQWLVDDIEDTNKPRTLDADGYNFAYKAARAAIEKAKGQE